MEQFKIYESPLLEKRNHLMRDIRNIQRQQIKKRARSAMLTYISNQELGLLISNTESYISMLDLAKLIKYANLQYPKAVAHLGNLILDGIVRISQIQKFSLQPGYHKNWLWFIEVLAEQQYCTLPLLNHCISTINPNRHEESVKNALSILYKITSSNLHSSILFRDQKALLAIIRCSLRSDSVSPLSYLLMNELIRKDNQEVKERYNSGVLRQQIVLSIKNGFCSLKPNIKRLSCKLLKQFALKGLFFQQTFPVLMQIIRAKDIEAFADIVILFLQQFVLQLLHEYTIHLIDQGLLIQLSRWKQILTDQQQQQLTNLIQSIRIAISNTTFSHRIEKQLSRLNLISIVHMQLC